MGSFQIFQMTTLDGEWTYEYDVLGQLTGADFACTNADLLNQNLTYEYDYITAG